MSRSSNTTRDFRQETDTPARDLAGLVRRLAIKVTSSGFWQGVGHLLLDGNRETVDAEVFSGVGFYARPAADANAEAVVVHVGGASNPVVIATRDEAARKAIESQVAQGATAAFNRATIILIKPDGTVEIRAIGGTAAPLATKADIDALKSWAETHAHTGVTIGAGTSGGPLTPPPAAAGTTVLKGQ